MDRPCAMGVLNSLFQVALHLPSLEVYTSHGRIWSHSSRKSGSYMTKRAFVSENYFLLPDFQINTRFRRTRVVPGNSQNSQPTCAFLRNLRIREAACFNILSFGLLHRLSSLANRFLQGQGPNALCTPQLADKVHNTGIIRNRIIRP